MFNRKGLTKLPLILLAATIVFTLIVVGFASYDTILNNEDNSTVKDSIKDTDKIAEKTIKIPETLQLPAKYILGIAEESPLNILIISLMLLIIFFSIFANIFQLLSPFSKNVSTAVAGAMTLILAAMGTIRAISAFLFNIGNKIKFLENLGMIGSALVIIFILLIWLFFNKIIKKLKFKEELEKAEEKGVKDAANKKYTEAMLHFLEEK